MINDKCKKKTIFYHTSSFFFYNNNNYKICNIHRNPLIVLKRNYKFLRNIKDKIDK